MSVYTINLLNGDEFLFPNIDGGGVANGITGGTNGLTATGQNLGLGGTLTSNTSIAGNNKDLSLGTAISPLNTLNIYSSGATFTDLNVIPQGIKYGGDYSLTYDLRSLTDKGYVDSVATGLHIHAAVEVATTGDTTLSGSPKLIDGISVSTGTRVLVKDQALGYQNGIYVVSAGNWSRSDDYNFSPSGEITNGDLIPVITGSTQKSTLWVLTTPDPISSGTSLNFSLFSQPINVVAGAGIDITKVGGNDTICVNLANNSGLCLTPTQLSVNPSIAGSGLTYNSGVLSVNASQTPIIGSAVNVKYCGACRLAVDLNDFNAFAYKSSISTYTGITAPSTFAYKSSLNTYTGTTALNTFAFKSSLNAYTGTTAPNTFAFKTSINTYTGTTAPNLYTYTASNGITKTGNNFILGGALTKNTNITGPYTLSLTGATKVSSNCGYQISGTTMFDASRNSLSNIRVGQNAGYSNTTGLYNIAIGTQALCRNTIGSCNVATGYQALYCNLTGSANAAYGYQALYNNLVSNNLGVGYQAAYSNTSGCSITAIGYQALGNNTLGCNNTALGHQALSGNTSGNYNTTIGYKSLQNNLTGSSNTSIGHQALYCNRKGSSNTSLGYLAGYSNITGSSNVYIGNCAGYSQNYSNRLYIANTSACNLIYGEFDTNRLRVNGTLEVVNGSNNYFYLGDISTDGSWRFNVNGDNLETQKKISGTWTTIPMGTYNSEKVTSPTGGTLNLKLATETSLITALTSGNTFTVGLPSTLSGKVNESILIFSIGASLPTITQPAGIKWRGQTPTFVINSSWTTVYEQVNISGSTWSVKGTAIKDV